MLGLMVGQTPPATWPLPGTATTSRAALVRRAALGDSVVELAWRPGRTTWRLLTDPVYQFYWHLGGALGKSLLPLHACPGPVPEVRPTLDPTVLEAALQRLTRVPLEPALLQLYPDGNDALQVLHHLIDQGQHRIDVLMYWWDSDDVGQALAEHLARWACQGGVVRVLVDTGGTLIHGEPKQASAAEVTRVINWLAHQPNVQVLRTRAPLARFDHRKLVLVDGKVAWTGGRNFTRVAFFQEHDLSFTVQGQLVERINCLFEKFWRDQGGSPLVMGDGPPSSLPEGELPANAYARLICTSPGHRELLATICTAISHARHHIYLENCCILDGRLICQLATARKRGVDVRVVLTLDTTVDLIDRANRLTINRLLEAGVRVYLFPKATHVKAMSVDGSWAYLGTGNFDALSLHRNRELGLAIGAGPILEELEQRLFLQDFRPEYEVTCPLPTRPGDRLCELLASFCL